MPIGTNPGEGINTSYVGEMARPYISAALLSGNTLSQGGIAIKQNIKFREGIRKFDLTESIKGATCDFTAEGTVTTSETFIRPLAFQINDKFCKQSFRSDWDAISMGLSAYDNLPKNFTDYLIGQLTGKVAQAIETQIWTGEYDGSGSLGEETGYTQFDGILTQLRDANDASNLGQAITGSDHAVVTAENVINKLGAMVDAIPTELYGNPDYCIYISQNVHRAYVRALGGFGVLANGDNASMGNAGIGNRGTMWYGGGFLPFENVKLFVANGLPNDTMVGALKSDLIFGTGVLNDSNVVKLIDTADILGDENVRFIMRYTAATKVFLPEQMTLYAADVTNL